MRQTLIYVLYVSLWFGSMLLVERTKRLIAARRRRRRRRKRPPRFETSLLVYVEEDGLLRPCVQILGGPVPPKASLRLTLVDDEGRIRYETKVGFSESALGVELPLSPFAPPVGAGTDEALRWEWDVSIECGRRRVAQWRERLTLQAGLNHEAELRTGR